MFSELIFYIFGLIYIFWPFFLIIIAVIVVFGVFKIIGDNNKLIKEKNVNTVIRPVGQDMEYRTTPNDKSDFAICEIDSNRFYIDVIMVAVSIIPIVGLIVFIVRAFNFDYFKNIKPVALSSLKRMRFFGLLPLLTLMIFPILIFLLD